MIAQDVLRKLYWCKNLDDLAISQPSIHFRPSKFISILIKLVFFVKRNYGQSNAMRVFCKIYRLGL